MNINDRDSILSRLRIDLIGPDSADEQLSDRPTDVYLTGILFPQFAEIDAEENESLGTEVGDDASGGEEVPLDRSTRPSSAGISFAVSGRGEPPIVVLSLSCGVYLPVSQGTGKKVAWKRSAQSATLKVRLDFSTRWYRPQDIGIPGLALYFQCIDCPNGKLVTAALVNSHKAERKDGRDKLTEKTFFQCEMRVKSGEGSRLVPRPSRISGNDDDAKAARLLYRNAYEFASGHTCSAEWHELDHDTAEFVQISWIPSEIVASVSSDGHSCFSILTSDPELQPLSATWLSEARPSVLVRALGLLTSGYRSWISQQEEKVNALEIDLREQAEKHIASCVSAADRMDESIKLLESNSTARRCFQLANKAMAVQRGWTDQTPPGLKWRPFQIAFILLNLPSLSRGDHPDRDIVDLLWFPTGGGKTEAYLGFLAFTFFHRRLRHLEAPEQGAGVAALMRYTLRLLTTQQFERAAALVMSCEAIRQAKPDEFGPAFSVGLWVGADSVPNDYETAAANLRSGDRSKPSPAQLTFCPACQTRLFWWPDDRLKSIRVKCPNLKCELGKWDHLPVWTVDDDVYRELPSLLLGTIDKFAQIIRNMSSTRFFGLNTSFDPPDLIIQDELHLISGPLGTLAGLYEVVIDRLCERSRNRIKVIGSTATIRRADPQIRALFGRKTAQFPPAGLDADDSCFAVRDESSPGRLYVGVTTAGRSAKFTLQATCASLLQSGYSLPDATRQDPYWTLVTYFNSLRELGGAVVLMQDDVGGSADQYARRRSEVARVPGEVRELTSRVSQLEIRDILDILKTKAGDPGSVDVLLASNMISVGVDIPRLGLMVVNGQPKGMSEYIQATSRVGRNKVAGLIVTTYNAGKARDRSHYETFCNWHRTLYREVDATSVTPFASRARDRALHAVLVGLVRHLVPGMDQVPVLSDSKLPALADLLDLISARAKLASNDEETEDTRNELQDLIERWQSRVGLTRYWWDFRLSESLLVSAERAAELKACGKAVGEAWPTPNSMRNVEPGTPFLLVERLASAEELEAKKKGANSGK